MAHIIWTLPNPGFKPKTSRSQVQRATDCTTGWLRKNYALLPATENLVGDRTQVVSLHNVEEAADQIFCHRAVIATVMAYMYRFCLTESSNHPKDSKFPRIKTKTLAHV
jgi:hypothetical protein